VTFLNIIKNDKKYTIFVRIRMSKNILIYKLYGILKI